MRITGRKRKFREWMRTLEKRPGETIDGASPGRDGQTGVATEGAVVEECGHGWPLLEPGEAISPKLIAGRGPMQSGKDCTRKWPKEVPLGEHTSLGPKSYCPDYRNLPVT
jgi:hypothetical protein